MSHYFSEQASTHLVNTSMPFNGISSDNDFQNISPEIIPLVAKLIDLCKSKGFFIKILDRSTAIRRFLIEELSFDIMDAIKATESEVGLAYPNFGLAFGVGIYESSALGHLRYINHQFLYNKVGEIGETIGLTWASNACGLANLRYFEFRPSWSKCMSDVEMINELHRRNKNQLSLLSAMA